MTEVGPRPVPGGRPRPARAAQPAHPEQSGHLERSGHLEQPGHKERSGHPAQRAPVRALAGAALSVCGVVLGIAVLTWVTDEPEPPSAPAFADAAGTSAAAPSATAPTPPAPTAPAPTAPSPVAAATPPAAPVPVVPVPAAPSGAATAAPPASSLVVPVTVLNNSRRDRLAARAAGRFERGGWPVALTGNFRGRIPVTTVYYDPGLEASARAFARTFAGMARVRSRFAGLPARGVVVVLTREFRA